MLCQTITQAVKALYPVSWQMTVGYSLAWMAATKSGNIKKTVL